MKLLITIPLFIVFTLAEAGLLKLVVYIAHTQWLSTLPTIDYLTAVLVLTGINFLISTWRVGTKIAEAINDAPAAPASRQRSRDRALRFQTR